MGAFHGVCRGGGGSVFVRLLAITLYPRMSWRRAVRSALRHRGCRRRAPLPRATAAAPLRSAPPIRSSVVKKVFFFYG